MMARFDDPIVMTGRMWFATSFRLGCMTLVASAILLGMAWTTAALAERRLAFVVGIDHYAHLGPDAQLQRAVSDAESISAQLSKLDFIVTTLAANVEVDQDLFLHRFSAWIRAIQPGDFVIFYFAGHGIGINNANYLVPANIPDLKDADEYTFRAHALAEAEIRTRIKESGARVTVLMLDACRNNPFASDGRAVALSRGLQPIEPTRGVLTIYSAGYGQTALDRLSNRDDPNPNSVFTRVLLTELQKPSENLLDLSENIREQVATLAQSIGHDQIPAVDNQLLGGRNLYLRKPEPVDQPSATPTSEDAMWQSIKSSNDRVALRRFVQTFPTSDHRADVEKRLSSLEDSVVAPSFAEDGAWHYLRTTTDAAALHRFLIDYPAGVHQEEAQTLLARLDDAAWQGARNSNRAADLRDFLRDFPGSPHAGLATARLQYLDDSTWAVTATSGRSAIERYFVAFPDARHRAEAEKRRAELDAPSPAIAPLRVLTATKPAFLLLNRPKSVPKIRRVAFLKPQPAPVVVEARPIRVFKTSANSIRIASVPRMEPRPVRLPKPTPQTTSSRCFDVNGERYCQ